MHPQPRVIVEEPQIGTPATAAELTEYGTEVSGEAAAYMRPSFWPTTHDILTPYMSSGGRSAFVLRAILAATLVPTWGIYSGYELVEDVPRPGAEEQIDNEKYEYKPRDFAGALERGDSLDQVAEIARTVNSRTRSMGMALAPCTLMRAPMRFNSGTCMKRFSKMVSRMVLVPSAVVIKAMNWACRSVAKPG